MGEDACRTFYGVSNFSGLSETQLVPFRVFFAQ